MAAAAAAAAALAVDQRYGLSCGKENPGKITVFHVKLTETAFRALEAFQNAKVRVGEGL